MGDVLDRLSDCSDLTFHFEEFIKTELGLRLGHDPNGALVYCLFKAFFEERALWSST